MGRRDRGPWPGPCAPESPLRREAPAVTHRLRHGMNRGGMWTAEGDPGPCGARGQPQAEAPGWTLRDSGYPLRPSWASICSSQSNTPARAWWGSQAHRGCCPRGPELAPQVEGGRRGQAGRDTHGQRGFLWPWAFPMGLKVLVCVTKGLTPGRASGSEGSPIQAQQGSSRVPGLGTPRPPSPRAGGAQGKTVDAASGWSGGLPGHQSMEKPWKAEGHT